ncbi:MAG TPA: formylglycine-generating enzyme family protein [Desulfobulbaceae bacterium]|nr:formylglycine-generating enzyme family protein [Desulfobulbaceae bacterium]
MKIKRGRTMNKHYAMFLIPPAVGIFFCFLLPSAAPAADKVVVIPLGGAPGNAVAADVVKGKTFSSRAAGKGATGSLKIRAGGTIYTNSIGMEFSLIPAGSFVMGSPDGSGDTAHRPVWPAELGRNGGELQHVVTLSKSFYMQTTEVTQGQWEQVMGSGTNPSHFSACGLDCPVESVSWSDANDFITALNGKESRTFLTCHFGGYCPYILPTESQWEYAARAGTVTAFYSGGITNTDCILDANLDKIGWYCGNANDTTHPVAQKEANNWGLYDMSGNVWEWCKDWAGAYPDGPVEDPTGASSGVGRVGRGGSWFSHATWARSATRDMGSPSDRSRFLGFRISLPSGQ